MATHSSVLAWRIPGMGETGGLPSMGSHRVGHDWSDLSVACMYISMFNFLNTHQTVFQSGYNILCSYHKYMGGRYSLPALVIFLLSPLLCWSERKKSESESDSVVSNSFQPHGLYSPWNSPGQNTGVGSLSFLQGIFPTQLSNPGLPHCRQIVYQISHKGSPIAMLVGMKKHLTPDPPVSLYSISHFPSCWKGFILQNFCLIHAHVDLAISRKPCSPHLPQTKPFILQR